MRLFLALLLLGFISAGRAEPRLPVFDAHLHYSHDAWDVVPVEDVIALLRKAGVRKALVSSSGDEGQQRLYRAAPDLVIPELRPYRRRGEIGTWFRDDTVVPYLEDKLSRFRYAGIGEYHIYGADVDLPVPRRMIQLARQYNLFLHSHSDADAIERQFRQWPQARILWAHAGFERPEKVAELLRRHGNLWCDLAFRTDFASQDRVDAAWRKIFLEFPDRFMLGTDTFTPERWHYVPEHADWSRRWLADLPREVAEQIAWKNGERLFGQALRRSD